MHVPDVITFFAREGLLGSRGVVAVSGGPDSVALAHVLTELLRQGHFAGLILAHVNHQLRGAESEADARFVADLGETWSCPGLATRVTRVDTAAKARGHNLEKAARDLRYAWPGELAAAEKATWVATAHSADDQAETVLHRLMRGSGLQGLAGILPRRTLSGAIEVVRPLLTMRRRQLRAYLEAHQLPCRSDSSN